MDLGISGKAAFVGGASSGLGFASASALVGEGVRVALCARGTDRLARACDALGPLAFPVEGDLSTAEGAADGLLAATSLVGDIDIVVPNSGGPPMGGAADVDPVRLDAAIAQSQTAMIELCRRTVPGMKDRGWGRVVAITSVGVRQPLDAMVYSNVARAGFTAYLKTLSRELAPFGVTVNSVLPGSQATDRLTEMFGVHLGAHEQSLLAGRLGDPADFGRVVAFLCSESANYVNGVALAVDGGDGRSLY